jgi:predicted dehydrogenase
MNRREFLTKTATCAATVAGLVQPAGAFAATNTPAGKKRLAIVGTGIRAIDTWGRSVVQNYSDCLEFVGLADTNPGRAQFAKKYIGVDCPVYTDFETMVQQTKPDTIIVTTVDAFHDRYITKAMQMGCDVITEKPMTTNEVKCQAILDAQKATGRNCIVTFNYRYAPHRAKIKELLLENVVGQVTSVDFHWYLDVYHGADYFRRWHRLREKSGTLLVHKASHHFDLLNWWLNSEPQELSAYGSLEFYGSNNPFRSTHCRACEHKDKCRFYYDITRNQLFMDLYAANEKHDGYLRDGCVWRQDIDIYDKMAVQIKYANGVLVSYSLTTYSPYEGYRIAFNGTEGRLEAWIQERQPWPQADYDEIRITKNFGKTELVKVLHAAGDHGGGDVRMKDVIFKPGTVADPLGQAADVRDGAMSILIGIAARKSIEANKPIRIADLTDLKPQAERPS